MREEQERGEREREREREKERDTSREQRGEENGPPTCSVNSWTKSLEETERLQAFLQFEAVLRVPNFPKKPSRA